MEDEDLEELGLVAWERIGNKNTRLYRYSTCIDSDNSITLPCNFSSLEAVTIPSEDWKSSTNYSDYGDINSAYIENYIEANKINSSPYYISGKLINYQQIDNVLYFDRNYGTINILYKGFFADEDGLPFLTDKVNETVDNLYKMQNGEINTLYI